MLFTLGKNMFSPQNSRNLPSWLIQLVDLVYLPFKKTSVFPILLTFLADTFYNRTEKIALTDSWTINKEALILPQREWMMSNCIHYLASDKPVGTDLLKKKSGVCPEKSAGHNKHEYTTGYAHEEIFKHFGFV